MVNLVDKFKTMLNWNSPTKRPLESYDRRCGTDRNQSSSEPEEKRFKSSVMEENGGDCVNSIRSYFQQLLPNRNVPPSRAIHPGITKTRLPECSVVGGVEIMSVTSSPVLPRQTLRSSQSQDDLKYLQSSSRIKKVSLHTSSDRHTQANYTMEQNKQPDEHVVPTQVGGNDGLIDADESFHGITVEDEEVSILQSSPSLASFMFQPSIMSTAGRTQAQSKKENKVHFRHRFAKHSQSPLRSIHPGRGVIQKLNKRALLRPFGLSPKYSSIGKECYKQEQKEAYLRLLSQGTSEMVQLSRTMSESIVPLKKTPINKEVSKQKMIEMVNRRSILQKDASGILLWSQNDQTIPETDDSLRKKHFNRSNESDRQQPAIKMKLKTQTVTLDDDDEDDLIITKETVKKERRPNSFEQQAKYAAYYKYDPKWMKDLNKKGEQRRSDLERQLEQCERTLQIASERRESAISAEDYAAFKFKCLDIGYPTRKIELEDELTQLTPEMEKLIDNAFRKHPPSQVLTEKFNIQITRKDVSTLSGLNWLNDEVINFYMNMLMERGKNHDNYPNVYAFNTFFYPKLLKMGYSGVKRWTKKVDVFAHDLMLVPVHLGMHWCLATINVKEKIINYYDSMSGNNNECLMELKKYLQSEHMDKKKSPLDVSDWKCNILKDIPQQMNGSDCGMFTCKFSEYLSRGKPITFTQEHMPYFRRRMVYEIVTNKLL